MKVNVNVKEVTGYNVDISEVKGIKSEVVGDDVRTANVELNYVFMMNECNACEY